MTVDQLTRILNIAAEHQSLSGDADKAVAMRKFAEALQPAQKLTIAKLVSKLGK